jgi:hypothetical protein
MAAATGIGDAVQQLSSASAALNANSSGWELFSDQPRDVYLIGPA